MNTQWKRHWIGFWPKRVEGQWVRNAWVERRQVKKVTYEPIVHPDDPGVTTIDLVWKYRLL